MSRLETHPFPLDASTEEIQPKPLDALSESDIEELISVIPHSLFTLKEPTEIEVLSEVFDALGMTPTVDDIRAADIHDEALATKLQDAREGMHEVLRLAINAYNEEYRPDGTRDIDALDSLYTATEAFENDPVIRALHILRKSHNSPVITHTEAIMRMLHDPR